MPGRLAQIDVHGGAVYGRNKAHQIYTSPLGRVGGAKVAKRGAVVLGSGNVKLLSQGRPTQQSSVGWGGVPTRGVDGRTDGYYKGK